MRVGTQYRYTGILCVMWDEDGTSKYSVVHATTEEGGWNAGLNKLHALE